MIFYQTIPLFMNQLVQILVSIYNHNILQGIIFAVYGTFSLIKSYHTCISNTTLKKDYAPYMGIFLPSVLVSGYDLSQ